MATMRSPLGPMSIAVKSIVTLMAVLMIGGLFGLLFADNVSVLGVGEQSVCVTDTTTETSTGSGDPSSDIKAAPGAALVLDAHPRYCTKDAPSTMQSLLNIQSKLAPFAFTVGALLLVLRLIKGAERDGLYTTRTAGRLRGLGWWLLAGSVLAAILTSIAERALVASLSAGNWSSNAWSGLLLWDVPYMAILTGLGILSFARIMRIGIRMREDLDGTV